MLVLSRKEKEEIYIGNNVTITILRVKGHSVRVGISTPKDVRVIRGELQEREPEDAPVDELPAPGPESCADATTDPDGCLSGSECPTSGVFSRRRTMAVPPPTLRQLARQQARRLRTDR